LLKPETLYLTPTASKSRVIYPGAAIRQNAGEKRPLDAPVTLRFALGLKAGSKASHPHAMIDLSLFVPFPIETTKASFTHTCGTGATQRLLKTNLPAI